MITLTLDATQTGLSLGLFGMEKPHTHTWPQARGSAELHPTLATLLAENGLTAAQLGRVVVAVGPGSFTGIRIGLAVAAALQQVHPGLAVVGLNTLQAVAWPHRGAPLCVVAPAAGPDVFTQTFAPDGTPTSAPVCLPLHEFIPPPGHTLLHTPGVLLAAPGTLVHAVCTPQALFELAENPPHHLPPHPLYVKPLTYTVQV